LFLTGALFAFFALFLCYPVGFLLKGAFVSDGQFSLRYFASVLSSPYQRECLANSFLLAALTTAGAIVLTLPLAHALAHWSFRGKNWLGGLLLVPLILPPFVGAVGLRQVFARFGSLNLWLMDLGVLAPDRPIDWLGSGGLWGIVALQVLHLYPILLLNLTAAMANVDPALREAAQNMGATGPRWFRTVTVPLILPGCFAGAIIVFIGAFTDLGTPLIFGFSRVVPVSIFDSLSDLNTNPAGYALVVVVLALTLAAFLASKRWLAGRRFEMLSRGPALAAETPASRAQTIGAWMLGGTVVLLAVIPHVLVVVQSFAGTWFFSVAPSSWTTAHFGEIFGHGLAMRSLRNSLFYSTCSAAIDLVLGVAIAWVLTRRRVPGAAVLDALAMLPLALPGLVIAFGYVAAFDWKLPWLNPRENPALLLIVSYSVRRLPYLVRAAYAGFQQTSVTLEEASSNLGATPWRTLRAITLPLVGANLMAGAILAFTLAMLEVSDGLILAMKEPFYPLTKTIWLLTGRIEPDATSVACALGVIGMIVLAAGLAGAYRLLGRGLGQLFR
jgi:iron(III) transport system permease protein